MEFQLYARTEEIIRLGCRGNVCQIDVKENLSAYTSNCVSGLPVFHDRTHAYFSSSTKYQIRLLDFLRVLRVQTNEIE